VVIIGISPRPHFSEPPKFVQSPKSVNPPPLDSISYFRSWEGWAEFVPLVGPPLQLIALFILTMSSHCVLGLRTPPVVSQYRLFFFTEPSFQSLSTQGNSVRLQTRDLLSQRERCLYLRPIREPPNTFLETIVRLGTRCRASRLLLRVFTELHQHFVAIFFVPLFTRLKPQPNRFFSAADYQRLAHASQHFPPPLITYTQPDRSEFQVDNGF